MIEPELTENAVKVLERRYLKKDDDGKVIETPAEMFWRVARAVAKAEENPEWADDFYKMMFHRKFMPNSPTLMNAGREMNLCSACFVIPVPDSIEGIFDAIKTSALTQKAGGGTGFSFSELRPTKSRVKSSGGTTSGPISFMKVFAKATEAIQQGAFRRGANMGVMRIDHPDIIKFINLKSDLKEMQNFNLSVMVTDKFMNSLKNEHGTIQHKVHHPKWGEGYLYRIQGTDQVEAYPGPKQLYQQGDRLFPWSVHDTWNLICKRAHATGEPGILFYDTINADNALPNLGPIEAVNPCSEQPLHSWSSCTLGSINLAEMVHKNGHYGKEVDFDQLGEVIRTSVRFLDDIIDINDYPVPEMAEMAKKDRRIGLGIMGWADMLFQLEIAYDSDEAISLAKKIGKFIQLHSQEASMELARERGVFGAYEGSKWQKSGCKIRNSHITTIAPTGTLSIIANCSGGCEPLFALSFERNILVDEKEIPTKMTETNKYFENAVTNSNLQSRSKDQIIEYAIDRGSISNYTPWYDRNKDTLTDEAKDIVKRLKYVFKTAHEISPEAHLKMQAAWQENIDSGISKTINFSKNVDIKDISKIYALAWELKCKGVSVYRDGCRDGVEGMIQPMKTGKKVSDEELIMQSIDCTQTVPPVGITRPDMVAPFNMPNKESLIPEKSEKKSDKGRVIPEFDKDFADANRVRFQTQFGTMHLKVVLDKTLTLPVEIFAQIGKGGHNVDADLAGMCRLMSISLQEGGQLDKMIDQLIGISSVQFGPGPNGKIYSLPDALAQALLKWKSHHDTNFSLPNGGKSNRDSFDSAYGMPCPICKHSLSIESGCQICQYCGWSKC